MVGQHIHDGGMSFCLRPDRRGHVRQIKGYDARAGDIETRRASEDGEVLGRGADHALKCFKHRLLGARHHFSEGFSNCLGIRYQDEIGQRRNSKALRQCRLMPSTVFHQNVGYLPPGRGLVGDIADLTESGVDFITFRWDVFLRLPVIRKPLIGFVNAACCQRGNAVIGRFSPVRRA